MMLSLLYSDFFFATFSIDYWEDGVKVFTFVNLSILYFPTIVASCVYRLFIRCNTFRNVIFSWLTNTFIIMKCSTLFLIFLFITSSILYNVNIAITSFLLKYKKIHWCISFGCTHFYTLLSAHNNKCSHRLAPINIITLLLTIFPMLHFSSLWLIYKWKFVSLLKIVP